MIHGHGDDVYRAGQEVKANFSTNVWYGSDVSFFKKLLIERADVISHYPEPDAGSFRRAVAAYHGLRPEEVIAGNGATELFYLVAHAFAGSFTVLPVPSFTEYEDACALYDHSLRFIRKEEIGQLPDEARLMFICNPNNPDGTIWEEEEIVGLLESYPDLTVVVDESFIHFAPEARSVCKYLSAYPNLLIIRSMTKSYAIPGLRLGYMLGDASLIDFIACYKQPWTVNALAIETGKYLLEQGESLLPDARALLCRQQSFSTQIAAVPGFYPLPSRTSFFLVRTDYDAARLKQDLLERYGILIRNASNFRGLNRHYFRINTLTEEKNRTLIEALKIYAG